MSWPIRLLSRRSSRIARFSNPRRPHARLLEPLESRWLLASDTYVEFNLASNQPGTALVTDPSLLYAWGIATSPGADGGFSVSDTSAGRSNSYRGDVAGSPFVANAAAAVDVPLATGQVYNGNANEFIVHSSNPPPDGTPPVTGGPAEFIYASLNGTIYGFNANLGQHAVPAVSVPGAAFTGLTLANHGTSTNGAGDQLYAADFLGGKIDVFDANFQPVTTSGSFTDPNLPDGYKPFSIQALDGELYVSYANSAITPLAPTAGSTIPIPAPGGVVDVFGTAGNFIGRIASGSSLDEPWGMALAPQSFGKFAGDLLVANHGSGEIDVFHPTPSTAATANTLLGTLGGADGNPFVVDGLLGLAFGNGDNAGDTDSLYFTAGTIPLLLTPLAGAATVSSMASLFTIPSMSHGTLGTIQVAAANPLVAVGTNTTANEGDDFSGVLASFGSSDLPNPTAHPEADYIATIDWGDGSSTALGTVVPTGNGGFLVVGSHSYTAAGTDDYTVTINDASSNTATATGTVQVTPATLIAKALPIYSDGLTVDNANVAVFSDTGGADPLTNYSATINWGDNSSSAGTVTAGFMPAGGVVGGKPPVEPFFVSGSHTYGAAGDYTFTVTISDTDGANATVTGTVSVATPTLKATALPVISQGLSLSNQTIADFVDTDGGDPLSNYSATIDWGDGSTSTGTIHELVADPAPGATLVGPFFQVSGSHTYAAAGDYTFTVTISDSDGTSATVTATAHIAHAPLLAVGVPVVVTTGLSVNGAIAAAFADADGGDPLASYSATIDWGDGSSSSAGSVTGSGNSFVVAGSHTYAASGDYTLSVAISDQDGSTATAKSHAFIDAPVASFVANAFQDVLHRAPDDRGLSFWKQQLAAGLPQNQFASDLAHSAEFYATNVINPDYQKYLGRPSDAAGLSYWTSQMQQGMTDQQLEASFISSNEFYAHAGVTNSGWINAMYQAVLGRQADSQGLAYWLQQLSSGASRSSIAMGFASSQEREAQLIQEDYFTYLGRSAGTSEVNYWVAQFEHGATNEDIVSGFVGSSEYFKLHS